MKVLHLNTLLTGGGTDDQCVKVILALRSLGVDARLMGPEGREFCKQVVASKLPQIISPPEGPLKIHFMRAVAREICQGGYDIVHAHHGNPRDHAGRQGKPLWQPHEPGLQLHWRHQVRPGSGMLRLPGTKPGKVHAAVQGSAGHLRDGSPHLCPYPGHRHPAEGRRHSSRRRGACGPRLRPERGRAQGNTLCGLWQGRL